MTESELTRPDGATLALRHWPLPDGERRATVVLVHGLGEHSGRYGAVAQALNALGCAVRGYDHIGHGRSSGPRGVLPQEDRLLTDLAAVVDATRAAMPAGEPLIVLGHSMGGLVAATFAARRLRPIDALVLSSPALAVFTNALQRLLLATLPRWLPHLCIANGLNPEYLSHDAVVVAAYVNDPLCHDRISTRLAHFLAFAGADTLRLAGAWTVPTLLMWASDDRMVDPAGSRALAAQAPPGIVTAHAFAGLYHEIFNEVDPAPVSNALRQWLGDYLSKKGR